MENKSGLFFYLVLASVIFTVLSFSTATKLPAVMTADVPDVVGLNQTKGQSEIVISGLVLGSMTRASSGTVPVGDIIIQNPAAGASVTTGTAVNLVISAGPARFSVPDVVGLTQADAQSEITAAELIIGKVMLMSSTNIPNGNVISQDPLAETAVTEESAVNLIVSSGPP